MDVASIVERVALLVDDANDLVRDVVNGCDGNGRHCYSPFVCDPL